MMRRGWTGRLGLRSLLLLGVLVPALGLAGFAAGAIQHRIEQRDASAALQDASEQLRAAVAFRAAVAREEVVATAIGLANDFGIGPSGLAAVTGRGMLEQLDAVRDSIDRDRQRFAGPRVAAELDDLDRLHTRLDRGSAGREDVVEAFAELNEALAREMAGRMQRIEALADRRPLDGDVRARLRTLRGSIDAFHEGAPRINAALEILLVAPTPEALADLAAAEARFDRAFEHSVPVAGTRAAAAWDAFLTDGAAVRTETIIETAREVATGDRPPWSSTELGAVLDGVDDGERWGMRLIAVVEAAASDLSAVAGDRAAEDDDAVRDQVLRALTLVVLTLGVALWTSRILVGPVRDLEGAARRVEAGEFDLPPVPTRGPREVTATVTAFNDMAATLAAVEEHSVALAEDPSAPVLDTPLPGRTGQAMQAALDRLRRSMEDAEHHRAELFELATRDSLTGLRNRASAYSEIERELARTRREGQPLVAVYVDLDGLKEMNDEHGHQAGDEALRRTADALRATTRQSDVVARLGGDEFLVVGTVPDGGPDAVRAFAERIHEAVRTQSVPVTGGGRVMLSCSVGVVLSSPAADTAEALIRAADAAMYRAKAAGRDRVAERLV